MVVKILLGPIVKICCFNERLDDEEDIGLFCGLNQTNTDHVNTCPNILALNSPYPN